MHPPGIHRRLNCTHSWLKVSEFVEKINMTKAGSSAQEGGSQIVENHTQIRLRHSRFNSLT